MTGPQLTPAHQLSRRAAGAVHCLWWIAHVGVGSDLHNRFVAAVGATEAAGRGFDALPAEFRALILRAEGKTREADALSYPKRPAE